VLAFRYRALGVAKAKPATMIHALEGAPVSEVAFSPWWRRRLAAEFVLPMAGIPEDSTPFV
jgi:hypothetical protein